MKNGDQTLEDEIHYLQDENFVNCMHTSTSSISFTLKVLKIRSILDVNKLNMIQNFSHQNDLHYQTLDLSYSFFNFPAHLQLMC